MHKEYGGPLLTEFQSRILETVGALHRRRDPRTGRMEATPLSVARYKQALVEERNRLFGRLAAIPAHPAALGSPPAPEERERARRWHAALWPNQY
jgi:hypothetical protein